MSQQPHIKKVIQLPKVRMLTRGRPPSGVRITNVQSIKPPDPELVKKQEEEKLRAQLQKEIEGRSRTCANKSYECTLPVLADKEYCSKHILQDPSAPYKQCTYSSNNGERCTLPAPVVNSHDRRDQGLCFEHAWGALCARQRSAAPPPPAPSAETLLLQLQHYVRPERTRTTSCASSVSVVSDPADQDQGISSTVDPFKQIDAIAVNSSVSASIMECASGAESDADSVTLGRDGDCRAGHHEDLSGDEDVDPDQYPLKYAGVFTAEEAVSEAKTALKLLQSAYVKQMGRLNTLLRMAKYNYLKSLKAEKEQNCSINSQIRSGPLTLKERRQLRKLKAYASYHKKHGVDAVLARKLHRKRAKVNDMYSKRPIPPLSRCTFAEGGVRCSSSVMPASKHCLRHVLHDRHQVLFVPCGDTRGGAPCGEVRARGPFGPRCPYHADPPHHVSFVPQKDGSDSDSDTQTGSEYSQSDIGEHSEDLIMDRVVQNNGIEDS